MNPNANLPLTSTGRGIEGEGWSVSWRSAAVFFAALFLIFCGCKKPERQFEVISKFSSDAINPHSLRLKEYFLVCGANKFGPLRGFGESRVAVLNSNLVVFFTTTDSRAVFNALDLTTKSNSLITVPGVSTLGDSLGSPYPSDQDVVTGPTNSIVHVLRTRGPEQTRYQFDLENLTCSKN